MAERLSSEEKLQEILDSHDLDEHTVLFRETLEEFLSATDDPDVFLLSAQEDAGEAVIDEYGDGHSTVATHVGPGLAFTETRENQWQEQGRVSVSVRLGDVLDQGGLIYPVQSVITDQVWYLTLPEGHVSVRRVTDGS